jgi:hypothetical protein
MNVVKKVVSKGEAVKFFRNVHRFEDWSPEVNHSDEVFIPGLFVPLYELKAESKLAAVTIDANDCPDFSKGLTTSIDNLIGTKHGVNVGLLVSRDPDNNSLFVISTDDPDVAKYLY